MNLDIGDTRLIIETCRREGLSRTQAAYVLATALHETARTMKPVREAFWLDEAWRKRNLRYYPYYGRGYVQLTWLDNYKRAGEVFGVDLAGDPDKALDPDIAAQTLVIGSKEGWFTGKKLSDYINGKTDWIGARRIINGTDKAKEIAAIAADYDKALKAEGYGANWLSGLITALVALLRGLIKRKSS